ncbi:MAG: phosphatidylserine decarboxylase [Gammaproteobacteria bacterium]|nr:phosphatidylserine decarboxylase [Gammaproteobacteria bacterium]
MPPAIQRFLPHHLLSRLIGNLASWRRPKVLKNWAIRYYIRHYKIDMTQAVTEQPQAYANFNDFFIRHLKSPLRPLAGDAHTLVSPADGTIDQLGDIELGRLLQAKGISYSLLDLLGGDEALYHAFIGGKFATIYLSPRDYHRVHMPLTGQLQQMRYVPGRLFSVNLTTAKAIDGLFTRNERAIFHFDSTAGPLVVIMVGAMLVASIHTVWAGHLAAKTVLHKTYRQQEVELRRGEELGYFQLGSTVIVLAAPGAIDWHASVQPGDFIKMGAALAQVN